MKHKDVIRSRVLCGHPAWLSCVIRVHGDVVGHVVYMCEGGV